MVGTHVRAAVTIVFGVVLVCATVCCWGLENGVGRTPQMGYNSWYDVRMNPTEQVLKETVQALKKTGLYDLGFRYVNIDDGMIAQRAKDGTLMPDPQQFPSGFKGLADYIHSEGMLFGVYTDRGPKTCGGRPAAQGFEIQDARTYASWGVDYVKEDSCNAPQDHQTAYSQYAKLRDALNTTGRTIFFSLCGWNDWYAPVGLNLGNSWRIGPDDSNWAGILVNIDMMAPLWPYAGPGGWNDPCLLLGRDANGNPAINDLQGRAQFTMWALLAAPMLLSQNVRNLTSYQLETYSNKEVIAVGQDILGRQGMKLLGGPLSTGYQTRGRNNNNDKDLSPLTLRKCNSGDLTQVWEWNVTAPLFLTNPSTASCANVNDCGTELIAYPCVTTGGTCAGPTSYANEQFFMMSDGTLRSALNSGCVTTFGDGYPVALQRCVMNDIDQQWSYDVSTKMMRQGGSYCLSVGAVLEYRVNVWGRPLADGSWAIGFINVDDVKMSLSCGLECLQQTGWEEGQVLDVRDLWGHLDLPQTTVQSGVNVTDLAPNGGVALFKVTPSWK